MTFASDIPKAEKCAADQRAANVGRVHYDNSINLPPSERKLAADFVQLALNEPLKACAKLSDPRINALFVCGALRF